MHWTEELEAERVSWTNDPIRRDELFRFLHLIRSSTDPERSSREERRKKAGKIETYRDHHKQFNKLSVEEHKDLILESLSDGRPKTFNRMMVELFDKTADVCFENRPDRALWELVEEKRLEHTMQTPIFFRRTDIVSKQLFVGPWSHSKATSCSQSLYWEKVERKKPSGRPDNLVSIDRRDLGKALHYGAELMMAGMKFRQKWPDVKKVTKRILKYYPQLTNSIAEIKQSLELFTVKFEFSLSDMLGSELRIAVDGDGNICGWDDCPPDGWRGIVDYGEFTKRLRITDYKNRPGMYSKAELEVFEQLSLYADLFSKIFPQVRDVQDLEYGIYYFSLGIHQMVQMTWDQVDENVEKLKMKAEHKEQMVEPVLEPGFGRCQYCDYLLDCPLGKRTIEDSDMKPIDAAGAKQLAKQIFQQDEKIKAARKGLNSYTAEHGPIMIADDTGFGHAVGTEKHYDVKKIAGVIKKSGGDPFKVLRVDAKELEKLTKGDKTLKASIDPLIKVTEKTKFQAYRPTKKKAVKKKEPAGVKARVKGRGRKNGSSE